MSVAQKKIRKAMMKVTESMGYAGRDVIPTDEVEAVKEIHPEAFRQYAKLRREYTGYWRTVLARELQRNKVERITYEDLLIALAEQDVYHHLPDGFTGEVDAKGKWWIKTANSLKEVNGVPSGFMFPDVQMNPNFGSDSPWVFQTIREDGTVGGYYYTRSFSNGQRSKKFAKVRDLLDQINSIRAKWLGIVTTGKESRQTVAAVILELLYRFSARVGSEGNGTRHGDATYGISTLRGKHCRITSTGFSLTYLGKDGVKTKHKFVSTTPEDEEIVEIVTALKESGKPNSPLFRYRLKSGGMKPVRNGVVNDLFRELGAGECTVHKLRTYHATRIAEELLSKLYVKRKRFASMKDAKAALLKVAEVVGKKLNHVRRTKEGTQVVTGATALANYIDVSLQVEFYQHYGLELPPALAKMTEEC